jgi:tetratricopeptide (TPR) repeat protein
LFGRIRRWFRQRLHRRDSLRKRQSSIPKVGKVSRQLQRASRQFTRRFFAFQAGTPKAVGKGDGGIRKPRWIDYLNPIHWIIWPLGFVTGYFLSRPYISLGPALFAIAVMIGSIALYAQLRYQGGRSSRIQLYQRLLADAAQSQDYKKALIASKTLIDLQPNDLRFQFERAQIEKKLGNDQLADDLMFRLASQKKYGVASLWLAEQRFDMSKMPTWTQEQHQLFRSLMAAAIDGSNGEILNGAKFKLSGYLSSIGANSEALRYLADIIPDNPQLAITACELARATNDPIRLQTLLPIAINFHRNELSKSPDSLDHRLKLARALVIDGDIDDAIVLLEDGQKLKPDMQIQNAIAEAYIYQGDKIARGRQTPEALAQRIQIVHRAATLAPNNPLVVEALVDLLIQCRDDKNQESATLREAALQGLDPESVHFIRGTIALMENKPDEAKTHLALASKSEIPMPGVLNNLAVAIASQEGGDLEEALRLANSALERLQHPYLYETRGQILFKMQKYQDCILDLEKGLQSPELATSIYASLIVAYEKLGNPSLAAEYSERLKVINQAKQKTELAVPQ